MKHHETQKLWMTSAIALTAALLLLSPGVPCRAAASPLFAPAQHTLALHRRTPECCALRLQSRSAAARQRHVCAPNRSGGCGRRACRLGGPTQGTERLRPRLRLSRRGASRVRCACGACRTASRSISARVAAYLGAHVADAARARHANLSRAAVPPPGRLATCAAGAWYRSMRMQPRVALRRAFRAPRLGAVGG